MTAAASVRRGLLIASGIHLDLYLTGYRTIPVIGWLYLAQVIAAFTLAWLSWPFPLAGHRRRLAAGPEPVLPRHLGGYLLSVWPSCSGSPSSYAAGIAAAWWKRPALPS